VQPSENIEMMSKDGHPVEIPAQIAPTDGIRASPGPLNHLSGMLLPGDESRLELFDLAIIEHIAAARDNTSTSRECKFRAAQHHRYESRECPRTSGNDRRCMAALVMVNGLEAYALLDTGSTTVSVTHDFAQVARLDVQQLENPVILQLGTVGSRSMINYGARTCIKFGSITEDNAYVDVVNIDRYNMIIGTPFMQRHRFVPDFDKNTLSTWGHTIPTLTSGQEDLMLAKKQALCTHTPAVPDGLAAHTSH
jgi:Aspartyl protease